MLHQLRQTRYIALAALMAVVAAICLTAGIWQVQRFAQKYDDNHLLRANAHRADAPAIDVLVPVGTAGADRTASRAQFRHVSATGTYDSAGQVLVREQTVNGDVGYLVLTPLRLATANHPALLVVRGFIAGDQNRVPDVAAAPSGTVTVLGRVQPDQHGSGNNRAPVGQVRSVDSTEAASRLDTDVLAGYVELLDAQPGQSGLTVIPDPDLSNPAGGAVEPQHLAYVIQWFLFALLALAAPLVMARADSRRPDIEEIKTAKSDGFAEFSEPVRVRTDSDLQDRLAERYGSTRRR